MSRQLQSHNCTLSQKNFFYKNVEDEKAQNFTHITAGERIAFKDE